ncbi:MAG TPA: DNA polymerase I [Kofleriaceae bacterium]|jgi:DNA polymerase-1|nr:DNA polymerase I [Kofleriaceae bacterium]
MAERLYIVDGHGYIFRAHYGLMNISRGERREVKLSTAEGMPTGALYVFSRMLLRLEEDNVPKRMAVVFDHKGGRNFRAEMYADYKAHRKEAPEELQVQMEYFPKIVNGLGWPCLAIPGVEADDVIATLVEHAKAKGWEVVIFSADKDIMQLIGDGVTMIDALHQKVYTREEVIKKMGVPPEKIPDFLALVGDTSDNIPGIRGVGDKTAAGLLEKYDTLDKLIAENPVVPRLSVKQPFSDPEQLERVKISRKLVELKRDVEVPELESLVVGEWDLPGLLQLFTELEFNLLVEKVKMKMPPSDDMVVVAAPEASPVAAVETRQDTRVVVRPDAIAEVAAAADKAGKMAITVELDPERIEKARMVAVIIAVQGQPPAYIPLGHRYIGAPAPPPVADLKPLFQVLEDPTVAKVCHDAKTVARAFLDLGVVVAGVVEDTMLAAFLLDPTQEAEPGETVVQRLGGVLLPARATIAGKGKTSLEPVEVERAAPWAGAITHSLLPISEQLPARLENGGLAKLYREIELPTALLLAQIERIGIHIDTAHFKRLANEVSAKIGELEKQIYELAGTEFNVGSPKQLGEILFEKLGLATKGVRRTKTGWSTEAETLEQLDHPIVAPIMEHREISKLKGTYLDALPPLVSSRTGRVHTKFNQVVAETGRISSQDPNLQNIPIRSDLGMQIRKGFIAAPGKVLIAADYSQIELRILAHLSGDPVLSSAFRDRVDVHTQTAAEVFSVARDQVTPEQRRIAKAVNYGLSYGQSDFGLARALDVTRTQAAEYSRRYFQRFPTIHKFMDEIVAVARAQGGARTVLGRWRPIPNLMSKSPAARHAAERVAQNTPMQGTGADIIKLAMLRTSERILKEQWPVQMLLTVHDELVFESPPDIADTVGAALKDEMENVYKLAVPLEVDIGIGGNWGDV